MMMFITFFSRLSRVYACSQADASNSGLFLERLDVNLILIPRNSLVRCLVNCTTVSIISQGSVG